MKASVLEGGVGGQRHAPAALPPGRDPVPIVQETGWSPGQSRRVQKVSPSPGFHPRNVHLIANRCTD